MALGDTLATHVAETTQEIIDATVMLMPQNSVMLNVVERKTISKGHDRLEIPRVNATFDVQLPTEGDEVTMSQSFDLTSTTIQPTLRVIYLRVSERSEYFGRDDVVKLISGELAYTQSEDIDTDLLAELANFASGNDVGSTNTDITFAVLRKARRLLLATTHANGGPAPMPLALVLSPLVEEELMIDLGAKGIVSSTAPWVPDGMSADMIMSYKLPPLLGVGIAIDGNMTENGSADFICGMFSRQALQFAVSKDWDLKTFTESSFIGTIIRSVADYNSGVGKFTTWGSTITADGA